MVDVIGMGSSSRPTDLEMGESPTPEMINEYFTEYLELWRLGMEDVQTRLYKPSTYYSAQ